MPLPIITALPSIISGVAQVGQHFLSRGYQKKQRDWRRQETDYAYSKDLEQWNRQNKYNREMWNLQNTYNTPVEQMKRFKEAGLNPNLIYGKGTPGNVSSPSASPQLGKYVASRQDFNPEPLDPMMMLSTFQDVRMKNAQIDNVKESTRHIQTKNLLDFAKIALTDAQTSLSKTQKQNLWRTYVKQGIELFENEKFNYKYPGPDDELHNAKDSLYYKRYRSQTSKEQAQVGQEQSRKAMLELEADWWKAMKTSQMGASGMRSLMMLLKFLK